MGEKAKAKGMGGQKKRDWMDLGFLDQIIDPSGATERKKRKRIEERSMTCYCRKLRER